MKREQLFKIALHLRDRIYKEKGFSESNNAYGFVFSDGQEKFMTTAGCYGPIRNGWGSDILNHIQENKIEFFVDHSLSRWKSGTHHKVFGADIKEMKDYVWWVVNESPFRHPHIEKDVETIFKKGCILDANYPNRYMIASASAVRYAHENCHVVHSWSLLKEHMNPTLAFFVSHFLSYGPDQKWRKTTPPTDHNTFLAQSMTIPRLKRFIQGNYVKSSHLFSEHPAYASQPLISVWGAAINNVKFKIPDTVDVTYKTTLFGERVAISSSKYTTEQLAAIMEEQAKKRGLYEED